MAVTVLTENIHTTGAAIVSEANGHRSRATVTIASGQNLVANSVLGIVTSGGAYAIYDNGASDGTQAAAGILYEAVDASAGAVVGVALVRDCEVNEGELVHKSGADATAKAAAIVDLATLGIIVRPSSPAAA